MARRGAWTDWIAPADRGQAGDLPGLSHGVLVLTGELPADAVGVQNGDQCRSVHPHGFDDSIPRLCNWCDHGNVAAERIADRIDYGSTNDDRAEKKKPAKFQPKKRKRKRSH